MQRIDESEIRDGDLIRLEAKEYTETTPFKSVEYIAKFPGDLDGWNGMTGKVDVYLLARPINLPIENGLYLVPSEGYPESYAMYRVFRRDTTGWEELTDRFDSPLYGDEAEEFLKEHADVLRKLT